MVNYDPSTWDLEYVKQNETECAEMLVMIQKVAGDALAEGKPQDCANGFLRVIMGLFLLCEIDADYYEPPLYAAFNSLARVEAFGLNDMKNAKEHFEMALNHAVKCAAYGRSTQSTAEGDVSVLRDIVAAFENGWSLSRIKEEFDWDYPNDIIKATGGENNSSSSNSYSSSGTTSSSSAESSGGGCGCIIPAAIVIAIIIFLAKVLISSGVLSFGGNSAVESTGAVEVMIVDVKSALNVRSEPSTDGEILTAIPDNAEVYVMGYEGEWALVEYNGVTGWCSSKYLK